MIVGHHLIATHARRLADALRVALRRHQAAEGTDRGGPLAHNAAALGAQARALRSACEARLSGQRRP